MKIIFQLLVSAITSQGSHMYVPYFVLFLFFTSKKSSSEQWWINMESQEIKLCHFKNIFHKAYFTSSSTVTSFRKRIFIAKCFIVWNNYYKFIAEHHPIKLTFHFKFIDRSGFVLKLKSHCKFKWYEGKGFTWRIVGSWRC